MTKLIAVLSALALVAMGSACGEGSSSGSNDSGGGAATPSSAPTPSLGQGGAQDFGVFRGIIEAGGIPGPSTLDSVGFFAEHRLEQPAPNCGDDVCVHGLLGSWTNFFNGARCDTVQIVLNTPIDPSTLERPPISLVVAVETSQGMDGQPLEHIRQGLGQMRQSLTPEDRLTLVTYDTTSRVLVEDVPPDDPQLSTWLDNLRGDGSTNLYDGLRLAYERAQAIDDGTRQMRVMLLSGRPNGLGILSRDRLVEMSSAFNEKGIGLTVVAVSTEVDVPTLEKLAEAGGGNFFGLESTVAVSEVFTEEVTTFFHPIAEDVKLTFEGGSYAVQALYGTHSATLVSSTDVRLNIKSLYIAHRTSSSDDDQGRRGGGGAILLKVAPQNGLAEGADPLDVGSLNLDYQVPGTDERRTQNVEIQSAFASESAGEDAFFASSSTEVGFVMLNIFVGFKGAATYAADGDYRGALHILRTLETHVQAWLMQTPDPDIEDDLRVLRAFADNLVQAGAEEPPMHPALYDPWANY